MWMLITAAAAFSAPVTLQVGIPTEAGTTKQIEFHGSGIICSREPAIVRCTADGPVTFEWTGSPAYTMTGPITVAPGQSASAWVLAAPGTRPNLEAQFADLLATETGSSDQIHALRQSTVYTSDWTPPWPTKVALDQLIALAQHPDHRIRREAVEALHPWIAGTSFDPLPVTSPIPVPPATLRRLAADADHGVRRRMARALRTARPEVDRTLARELLEDLLSDGHPGVRRAAVVALPEAVDRGILPGATAWEWVVKTLPQPRPAGRAACNQLARLHRHVQDQITDEELQAAFATVLNHHPERGWTVWWAWKDRLPVRETWIRRLVQGTVGLDPPLVTHWARTEPEALARVLNEWVPTSFPERKTLMQQWADNGQ